MRPIVALLLLACPLAAFAANDALAGLWQTMDDRTGNPDGLVRIEARAGGYDVTVVAVYSPPAPEPDPLCEACEGELRNRPVIGLTIARGLAPDAQGWAGWILDPKDGRTYRCTLRLAPGGARLEVRGYVGIPLFGRSQVWTRRE